MSISGKFRGIPSSGKEAEDEWGYLYPTMLGDEHSRPAGAKKSVENVLSIHDKIVALSQSPSKMGRTYTQRKMMLPHPRDLHPLSTGSCVPYA